MGERIKYLRQSHGYTQQHIADYCGVNLRTYQFWQAGHSPPSQESVERLAELFDVTTKYILRGETPELLPADDQRLAMIEQRLSVIEGQLGKLLGAAGMDGESQGDLADRIVRTVERAINQRATEVGRPHPPASPARRPHQDAA